MPSSGVSFGRAVILAVGSELLTPLRIDTNSLTITGARGRSKKCATCANAFECARPMNLVPIRPT